MILPDVGPVPEELKEALLQKLDIVRKRYNEISGERERIAYLFSVIAQYMLNEMTNIENLPTWNKTDIDNTH